MPSLSLDTLQGIKNILNYDPSTRTIATRKEEETDRIIRGHSTCVDSYEFSLTSEEGDLAVGDLTITFVGPPNGGAGTWVFHEVPMSEYINFVQAQSLGTYFNDYIKNQYDSERA